MLNLIQLYSICCIKHNKWEKLRIPIFSLCILLFFKFLMYFFVTDEVFWLIQCISITRIKMHLDLDLIFENNWLWKELPMLLLLSELYFDNSIIMQQLNKNDILTDYHQLRYSCMYSKLWSIQKNGHAKDIKATTTKK